jgi:lysophospholipase L1-like esterase
VVRLLVAVVLLMLLGAVPSTLAADGLTLDWSVDDRLAGPASVDERAPAKDVVLRVAAGGGPCPTAPQLSIDGEQVTARRDAGCTFSLAGVAPGQHKLALDSGDGGQHAEAEIDVRDFLVASIGDSVASGEGNPDGPGVTWLEKRCHRSLRSGAAQAVKATEAGDRHSVITFVPLACSGATIDEGLLGSYAGVQKDRRLGVLPPQADVVRDLPRSVDALLVSVGANDVHFGALARFCMFVTACPTRHFDPAHPYGEAATSFPTAAEVERQAIADLATSYDKLAARLDGKVDPAKIIFVEYFDPLRDAAGNTCSAALPHMDAVEADWAQRNVLAPLNAQVNAAAARHGWQVVGGVSEAFRRHGICAKASAWVADPLESAAAELAITGTLHPNRAGHAATAMLVAPVLAGTLGVGPGVTEVEPSRSGWVRWPWLLLAAAAGAALGGGAALLVRRRRAS